MTDDWLSVLSSGVAGGGGNNNQRRSEGSARVRAAPGGTC